MGCIGSRPSQSEKRSSNDLAIARSNFSNEPISDADLVRKKDEIKQVTKLAKTLEQMNKKIEQQNNQLIKLKKQNQKVKKQSKDSVEERQMKLKKLQNEKNKQIEKLRKQLQKEKLKLKQNKQDKPVFTQPKEKEQKSIGVTSLETHKSLCDQCFYKLSRYIVIDKNMSECYTCKGYGLILDRFPYGANPSCDKSLCFSKGWDKVKCLKICTICNGKGYQEFKMYYARKY